MVCVGEIQTAHHIQRLVVVGVKTKVLQQQLAAYDAYWVVVEAHADAVGDADEVSGVDIELTVDIWMTGGSPDGHAPLCIALEAYNLVRHEAVDE